MKYTYCPACNRLQKWNWYSRGKCDNCGKDLAVFTVRRSIFGIMMYAVCAVAIALIACHAAWYTLGLDWASFYSVVPSDLSTWVILGLLVLAIVFTYLDLGKTQKMAAERVKNGINKPPK